MSSTMGVGVRVDQASLRSSKRIENGLSPRCRSDARSEYFGLRMRERRSAGCQRPLGSERSVNEVNRYADGHPEPDAEGVPEAVV